MKIINAKAEFYNERNPLKRIERIARVCWNTEDKITEASARPFCEKLLKMGHTSPFEHARVRVPILRYAEFPNITPLYGYFTRLIINGKNQCVYMNARDFLALGGSLDDLETFELADDFATVRFTVDIGISRELVRHRQFSFMERSTRYVNMKDGIEFILPLPFEWTEGINTGVCSNDFPDAFADPRYQAWYFLCEAAEDTYQVLLQEKCPPQEARNVLPLSTATALYVTGMYNQWHDLLKLRLAKSAHPQMQLAMRLMLDNPDCPEEIKSFEQKGN